MRTITDTEFNAILAGLRLLQERLWEGTLKDGLVCDLLTNGDSTDPITSEGIDELCEALNAGDVQFNQPELFCTVMGNPFDGMTIYGPFGKAEDATSYAEDNSDGPDWWMLKLAQVAS